MSPPAQTFRGEAMTLADSHAHDARARRDATFNFAMRARRGVAIKFVRIDAHNASGAPRITR